MTAFRWTFAARLLGVVLPLLACRNPESREPPLRLAVVIVVDQMLADEIAGPGIEWPGGFGRLVREGRWYSQAFHGHAHTETASGHATIATGVLPRLHGIVSKRVFRANEDRLTLVCDFGLGPCERDILLVPTIGDRLKAVSPTSRVVSIANKPRAGQLLGGARADLAGWVRTHPLRLEGRTNGRDGLPGWWTDAYSRASTPSARVQVWTLPALPPGLSGRPDEDPDEIDPGYGLTFPHRIPGTPEDWSAALWQQTADGDRAILDAAFEAVRWLGLGRGESPDLLLLSLSTLDNVGHYFGPDSLERAAALADLDRLLGRFLERLGAEVGGGVLVALTADHGVAPTPGHAARAGHPGGRVRPEDLLAFIERGLEARLGPGHHVASVWYPYVSVEVEPVPDLAAHRATLAAVVAEILRAHPRVYGAWPVHSLAGETDPIARLLFENSAPSRSGDVAFALKPWWTMLDEEEGFLGAEHGTPWEYDRHVPLVLWGPGVAQGRVDATVQVIDLGRSLGDALGLVPIDGGGRPLP